MYSNFFEDGNTQERKQNALQTRSSLRTVNVLYCFLTHYYIHYAFACINIFFRLIQDFVIDRFFFAGLIVFKFYYFSVIYLSLFKRINFKYCRIIAIKMCIHFFENFLIFFGQLLARGQNQHQPYPQGQWIRKSGYKKISCQRPHHGHFATRRE